MSLIFLVFSYIVLAFPMFFLVFASISLVKNKKIQALVKFFVFLIQKIECIFRGSLQGDVLKISTYFFCKFSNDCPPKSPSKNRILEGIFLRVSPDVFYSKDFLRYFFSPE